MDRSTRLVDYINSLTDFPTILPVLDDHIGAVITDAALQAGISYFHVVRPRVLRVIRKYPDAVTTKGFAEALARDGANEVLNWKDARKIGIVQELVKLLADRHIETIADLRQWLQEDKEAPRRLKAISGIGPKTADYLRQLVGLPAIAIDSRLIKFLNQAGVSYSGYKDAASVIQGAAVLLNVDPSVLDHRIWTYMSPKSGPDASCPEK